MSDDLAEGARAGSDATLAPMSDDLAGWAEDQRRIARALGLTVREWQDALGAAGERRAGLMAAAIGASVSRGLGLSVLEGLDGPALAARARALLEPEAPAREVGPVLAAAIRRAEELGVAPLGPGGGAARLRREIPTPLRGAASAGSSALDATADAPGGSTEP